MAGWNFKRAAATVIAGAFAFGSGFASPMARADGDGPGDKPDINTQAPDKSIDRIFGMLPNGTKVADPWIKDAKGNYTNPDAIIAHKASSLYIEGSMLAPVHPMHKYWGSSNDRPAYEPDWGNRYKGADEPGTIAPLMSMFKAGDDRTKAIILAVVISEHDQARAVVDGTIRVGNWGIKDYGFYQQETTPEKIRAAVDRIEQAPSPYAPKDIVTDAIWANTNGILDIVRKKQTNLTAAMAKRATEYGGDYRAVAVNSILNANGDPINPSATLLVASNQKPPSP